MLMNKKTLLASVATLAMGLCLAGEAHAATMNLHKVVRTNEGRIVREALQGTCVRTDWQGGSDPCAPVPPAPKVVAYVPPPPPPAPPVTQKVVQEVLGKDERTVYFEFNSSKLTPEAQTRLDGVAQKLTQATTVKDADIVGFTDRIGSNSYNKALSEKRAEAVKDYLASRGYINTRVADVRGVGKDDPVVHCPHDVSRNKQIECLSPNRRVELELNYTTQVQKTVVVPGPSAQAAPQAAPVYAAVPNQQPAVSANPYQNAYQPAPQLAAEPLPQPQGQTLYSQSAQAASYSYQPDNGGIVR